MEMSGYRPDDNADIAMTTVAGPSARQPRPKWLVLAAEARAQVRRAVALAVTEGADGSSARATSVPPLVKTVVDLTAAFEREIRATYYPRFKLTMPNNRVPCIDGCSVAEGLVYIWRIT